MAKLDPSKEYARNRLRELYYDALAAVNKQQGSSEPKEIAAARKLVKTYDEKQYAINRKRKNAIDSAYKAALDDLMLGDDNIELKKCLEKFAGESAKLLK